MLVQRALFAVFAKIKISANSALVTDARDFGLITTGAQWAVAINVSMTRLGAWSKADVVVNRNEPMVGVFSSRAFNAFGAVVPIGANKTFVAHAYDGLEIKSEGWLSNRSLFRLTHNVPCHNHRKGHGGSCCVQRHTDGSRP